MVVAISASIDRICGGRSVFEVEDEEGVSSWVCAVVEDDGWRSADIIVEEDFWSVFSFSASA